MERTKGGKETGVRKRRRKEAEMMTKIMFTEEGRKRVSDERRAKGDHKKERK